MSCFVCPKGNGQMCEGSCGLGCIDCPGECSDTSLSLSGRRVVACADANRKINADDIKLLTSGDPIPSRSPKVSP